MGCCLCEGRHSEGHRGVVSSEGRHSQRDIGVLSLVRVEHRGIVFSEG